MSKSWRTLEDHVRGIAALRWNSQCNPEHIDGVDFDGVVRIGNDEVILIEITEERSLNKVRDDIRKIYPTKLTLATKGIICRAFIVLAEAPTNSMTEAGQQSHIKVCSVTDFEREFFDFQSYYTLRILEPFGSAIDAKTGTTDTRPFIPVRYLAQDKRHSYGTDEIVQRLVQGDRIALTGDYGTGKSRCIKEVFGKLANITAEAGAFPVAINLRDHWGSSTAIEILAGHLSSIGLSGSIDNAVRLLNSGHLILLLDGFDEVGAQTFDIRLDDRSAVRRRALKGVKDIVQRSKTGVLIAGRSHFFDSDDEMLHSMGLSGAGRDPDIVVAPESFSIHEGENYLSALGIPVKLPDWLPRKPLVFQILATLPVNEVAELLSKEYGPYTFWGTFLIAVCNRESAGVHNAISAQTIMSVLLEMAAKTRYSDNFLGRLSPSDLSNAYERAVGSAPDESGRQMLARMCTLGRIEPESPNRQFIDYEMVDILRAIRLIEDINNMSGGNTTKQWRQLLKPLGAIHAAHIIHAYDLEQQCMSFLAKHGNTKNTNKLAEIIAALTVFCKGRIDFKSLTIIGGEFPVFRLTDLEIVNLSVKQSIVGIFLLENIKEPLINLPARTQPAN